MVLSALAIAGSALSAQRTKFAVAANNIANINTPQFKPSRVVLEANPKSGVSARIESMPLTFLHGQSHLSLAGEILNQMTAERAYQSALNVASSQDAMAGETLDLLI